MRCKRPATPHEVHEACVDRGFRLVVFLIHILENTITQRLLNRFLSRANGLSIHYITKDEARVLVSDNSCPPPMAYTPRTRRSRVLVSEKVRALCTHRQDFNPCNDWSDAQRLYRQPTGPRGGRDQRSEHCGPEG